MTLADEIRSFVIDQIIIPARVSEKRYVIIRSGDIHRAMNLNSRMPAVCSAIGSNKFLEQSKTKQVSRKGPNQGATVEWVFEL